MITPFGFAQRRTCLPMTKCVSSTADEVVIVVTRCFSRFDRLPVITSLRVKFRSFTLRADQLSRPHVSLIVSALKAVSSSHTPFPPIFPLHPRCALYARIPVLPSRGGSKGVYHKTRGARIRRGLRCVVRVSRRDRGTEVGSCVPASRQQCRCRRVHVATRPPPPFVGRTTLVVSLGLSRRIVALFSLPSLSSQFSKHESLAKIG